MKKVMRIEVCVLLTGLLGFLFLSVPVEAEEAVLQENGNSVKFEILDRGENTARVRFTLMTQSVKTATLAVSLSRGEAVEYFLEQIARHEQVDFFTQCPEVTPSVAITKIRLEWSPLMGLRIIAHSSEKGPSVFSEGGGSFLQVLEKAPDESLEVVNGLDEDYSRSECFQQPMSDVASIGNPEFVPPVLDAQECANALKDACYEPLIVNQMITILSDIGGAENQRNLDKELQGKRRLLARALRSEDITQINRAVRAVRRFLRRGGPGSKIGILSTTRNQRIAQLLATKGASRNSALQKVVKLLKV